MTQHTVESMLQTIYNLNWKGRKVTDTPDWVKFDHGENAIVIFPTAADFLSPNAAHTIQVKWEIDYANQERVINLTINNPLYRQGIESILKEYLGYPV